MLAELPHRPGGRQGIQNKRAIGELTSRKREIRWIGRWQLEAKEKVKKRGGRSPDWGDAVAMCYAPRPKTGAEALIEFMRQQYEKQNAIARKQIFNFRTGQIEAIPHNRTQALNVRTRWTYTTKCF